MDAIKQIVVTCVAILCIALTVAAIVIGAAGIGETRDAYRLANVECPLKAHDMVTDKITGEYGVVLAVRSISIDADQCKVAVEFPGARIVDSEYHWHYSKLNKDS